MENLLKLINLLAGIVLFTANIIPFVNPEVIYHQAYQIELTTPQSYTVPRTLSVVLARGISLDMGCHKNYSTNTASKSYFSFGFSLCLGKSCRSFG